MTWRQATRSEIARYYRQEFPDYLEALPGHVTASGPKQFALAFREPYPVSGAAIPDREFIRRDTRQTNADGQVRSVAFDDLADVSAFIRQPAQADPLGDADYGLADPALLEQPAPVPEAVYYALDHWERSWPLLVDIDAKDIATERSAAAEAIEAEAPEGYPYGFADIDRALEYAFEVAELFETRLNASETQVVYSGQGAHVYMLDDDLAHRYDEQSRAVVTTFLEDVFEVPIDAPVTTDRRRVARLPYSLHADVSRVVQPIDSPDFDVRNAARPAFLAEPVTGGAQS